MKKFIAFHSNGNSKVCTKEEAYAWATKQLGGSGIIHLVHIAEVMEVAERTTPTIEVKTFFAELDPSTAEEKLNNFKKTV